MATKGKSRPLIQEDEGQEVVQNKIALDELIPVISLLDYPLNLLQMNNGRAKYKFDKFGQRKEILYQDVLLILEQYRSFMESGYFIILDKRVVNRHGLQELQSSVLTKEKIEKILEGSTDAFEVYKQAIQSQQRTIVQMITQRLVENPDSMDKNIVDQISRHSKINILQNAEDARALLKKEEPV